MRLIGAYTRDNVCALLPRVTAEQLLGYFELPLFAVDLPWSLADLAVAAASAFALTSLEGRGCEVAEARRAAVAALPEGSSADRAAERGRSERAVRRVRAQPAAPDAVRAVKLQLRLRAARRADRARQAAVAEVALPRIGRRALSGGGAPAPRDAAAAPEW